MVIIIFNYQKDLNKIGNLRGRYYVKNKVTKQFIDYKPLTDPHFHRPASFSQRHVENIANSPHAPSTTT